MALRKHEIEWEQPTPAPAARKAVATPSPARALQHMLEQRASVLAAPHIDKWSQRRALTFMVTSAAALWMAILMAAHQAVAMVA